MDLEFYKRIENENAAIKDKGLWKPEHIMTTAQGAVVSVANSQSASPMLNLCANNYLGLAQDRRVINAASQAMQTYGAGLASVRFICGTQQIHKDLETAISEYLGYDDALLFAGAFDANGGVFEPLLDERDVIISDELNHASVIDGVRLSKATRFRYRTNDMEDLNKILRDVRNKGARTILIATDGVFSMDGTIANLGEIVQLAEKHHAITLVDDCHATGFLGSAGRGSAHYRNVAGKIDILTSTFGKALGGAMGGFVAASKAVVELLRQRARPYLFSNSLAPAVCGISLAAISIARSQEGDALREKLFSNTRYFRNALTQQGWRLLPGEHPIIPIMLGDALKAQSIAAALFKAGVYVVSFSFPVVPQEQARLRTQMSAAHTQQQLDQAIEVFAEVGKKHGVLS